jgi:RNA polymerase sigma-70 factor (ECF subfamily)
MTASVEADQTTTPGSADEARLVAALRRGDERAFAELLDTYHASLVRIATYYVRDAAVAEEVAQDTWLGVLHGIQTFEGRSTLKTWIFRILRNRAATRGERERRTVPFTALDTSEPGGEPSVEPDRFLDSTHPVWPGHWASPPAAWDGIPERQLVSSETLAQIQAAIDALPPLQAQVISLRDVDGWSSEEVCELLGLSEVNQRVLLHRARSKVRGALEAYLAEGIDAA